jgi:hypothetical protein
VDLPTPTVPSEGAPNLHVVMTPVRLA